jgi:hypothetical protein
LKLVFEGKISLEGSLEEVKSPLGIFLSMMAKQLTETGESVVSEQPESVSEPVAEVVAEPVIPTLQPSIVSRVLDFISENPNKTNEDIASAMGLKLSQVKTAVLTLNQRKQIVPLTSARNSGWKMPDVEVSMKKRERKKAEPMAEIEDAPVGIANTIMDCMRKNPGSTAREIAIKSGMPYDRVTSLVHGLKTANKATFTGKGGHHDPYRYSIV